MRSKIDPKSIQNLASRGDRAAAHPGLGGHNTAANVKLDTLGLTVGVIYSLDVFHAERHTTQSNFRIDTTICSVPQ